MRKYIVLFGGFSIFLSAFIFLYASYAPRVGPIGNGPNDKWIWFQFGVQLFTGLSFTLWGILIFLQEKRKDSKASEPGPIKQKNG